MIRVVEEAHLDRQGVGQRLQRFGITAERQQPGRVLLGNNNHFPGKVHGPEPLPHGLEILRGKQVMVGEEHRLHPGGLRGKVAHHGLRRHDARHEQDARVAVGQGLGSGAGFGEHGLQRPVAVGGKVEALPLARRNLTADALHLIGREVDGAFAYYYNISTSAAAPPLAQPPGRQRPVAGVQAGIVGEQHGQPRADGSVLQGIVQHHHVQVRAAAQQFPHAVHPPFVHGQAHVRVFTGHLIRLVAYLQGIRPRPGQHEAPGTPLVASAQHRRAEVPPQCIQHILGVRRLARAPHREVTDADGRHVHCLGAQHAPVEQPIADAGNQPVQQGEGEQEDAEHGEWILSNDANLRIISDWGKSHEGNLVDSRATPSIM